MSCMHFCSYDSFDSKKNDLTIDLEHILIPNF